MLNFYMDESGQNAKGAPLVVVGGFAIETDKVKAFEEAVKRLYFQCYGVVYDGTRELKGTKLLSNKLYADSLTYKRLLDEERRIYCEEFIHGQRQIRKTNKHFAAYAQAGFIFVEGLADLLVEFECSIFACMTSKEIFNTLQNEGSIKSRGPFKDKKTYTKHSVSGLLRKMENRIYANSALVLKEMQIVGNFSLDSVGKDLDLKRQKTFDRLLNPLNARYPSYIVKNEGEKLAYLKFSDSQSELCIQIADLILFCINWGFDLGKFSKDISRRNEIQNLKLTHLAQQLSNVDKVPSSNCFFWFDGKDFLSL